MTVEELFLWWHDLPLCAKVHYTGSSDLDPERLPWDAFRSYVDLDNRVYRPFNPETMDWWEYMQTSDYLVYRHHQLKKEHAAEEEARQFLQKNGYALAETYKPDIDLTMRDLCEGCQFERLAQHDHRCLCPQNENSFL